MMTGTKRKTTMPKPYVLKNSIVSQQKIDRILKSIKDNADTDRIEASNLLEGIKEQLSTIDLTAENGLDGYTKLIAAALSAINQMGNANDKLIKLSTILQKYMQSKKEESDLLKPGSGSFFSQLTSLAGKKDQDTDD